MKTSKKLISQQAKNPYQQQIQQYLNLKPHRAVQRLLQQNSLNDSFELYGLLQQNVKANTSQLRRVLYSKHQNLYQCSQMIHKIQDFTVKIKAIQEQIDTLLNLELSEEDQLLQDKYLENPINRIQYLMNDKRFTDALKQCSKTLADLSRTAQLDEDNNLYYVSFLKVQIIQKLETHLQCTPLTKQLIRESTNSIKEFMKISPENQLYEIIQRSPPMESQSLIVIQNGESNSLQIIEQNNSLLSLLYEKCIQNSQAKSRYPLQQQSIIEVIFKFKLLSLKPSLSTINLSVCQTKQQELNLKFNRIYNYFADLLELLRQTNSELVQQPLQGKKLYQIFNLNVQKVFGYISQLFILDLAKSKGIPKQYKTIADVQSDRQQITLSFQNQLYERLLSSQKFVQVLQSLSSHFSTLSLGQNQSFLDLISLIKNLWKDFYHQLLDIITDKIDPIHLNKLPLFQQVPQEILKFYTIQYGNTIKERLSKYNKQLKLFFGNFEQLLKTARTKEQRKDILDYFLLLKLKVELKSINEVENKLQRTIKGTVANLNRASCIRNQNTVRETLLLFLSVETYNIQWGNVCQEQSGSCLIDSIKQNSYSAQQFCFSSLFYKNTPESQSQPIIYTIINSHINSLVSHKHLTPTSLISSWQQQFDKIFSYFNKSTIQNQLLIQKVKILILTLIKTKLKSIQ